MDLNLIRKLVRLHLLSPAGLVRLGCALGKEGVNLMALLCFARKFYAGKTAIAYNEQSLSYAELYRRSKIAASYLYHEQGVRSGMRIAVLCHNHDTLLYALFALSSIGADVYLLNTDMSEEQLNKTLSDKRIQVCICDNAPGASLCEKPELLTIRTAEIADCIMNAPFSPSKPISRQRFTSGELIVMTGGTSGNYKTAGRRPSLFKFLYPFFSLLAQVHIDRYEKVYIAPPIFHGFGLAAVIVTLLMGKTLCIRERFSVREANELIDKNKIDLLVAVPTMLHRMLRLDPEQLRSLKCILSGGAALDKKLVRKTERTLGRVLYNLYGTSEAGFFVMATPEDLYRYPCCIGRPIMGVKIKIADKDKDGTGVLCVKSAWAMRQASDRWQSTGDRVVANEEGILFLKGRTDDMIVSGAENVYPEDVENILLTHSSIEQVAVTAVPVEDFGHRLQAFVVVSEPISEGEIRSWLKPRIARFQMPCAICVVEALPVRQTGKINKKDLLKLF